MPPLPADMPKDPRELVDPPAAVVAAEPDVIQRLKVFAQPIVDRFDPLVQVVQNTVEQVTNHLNPPLTAEQREALQVMHAMLAPNKLGGADRTFGYEDVAAVAAGISDGGFKGAIARRVAPGQMRDGLEEAGVTEPEKLTPDRTRRRVSLAELRRFAEAGDILRVRAEPLERMGLRVVFPNGISQDAVQHMIDEKPGIPPGGKLEKIPGFEG